MCTANGSTSDPEAVKVCNKLEYTLKYDNGANVAEGDTILSKQTQTMVLKIKYQEFNDPSLLPTTNVSISGLGIDISYSQSGNAKVNPDGTTPLKIYTIGEEVTVLNEKYNVIGVGDDYVTLLKQEPLTLEEVNANKIGNDNINHVNRYTGVSAGEAFNYNGYGGMAYYSSETCGYNPPNQLDTGDWSACTTSYDASDIKYIVDNWATKFTNNELKEVTVQGYGTYKARLATKEELQPIGWPGCVSTATYCPKETSTPSWLHGNYFYWTMSSYNNSSSNVWDVLRNGRLSNSDVGSSGAVRPVLNIYKSKI